MPKAAVDSRFVVDDRFEGEAEAESSTSQAAKDSGVDDHSHSDGEHSEHEAESNLDERMSESGEEEGRHEDGPDGFVEGMLAEGFSGPSKVVKPLTAEELAKFKAAQEKTGVVYISRIPPGMQPAKVRHLMSMYGEIGRVYLQPEGALSVFGVINSLTETW